MLINEGRKGVEMKKKAMQRRCRKILTILCFTFLCIIGISVHVQADTDIGVSELTEDERYNSEYYKPITKRAKTRAASMDSFENYNGSIANLYPRHHNGISTYPTITTDNSLLTRFSP